MPDGFIVTLIKSLILANLVMGVFAILTWAERRLLGRFQVRLGPNRVGPFGLLQPIADLVKLIRKESLMPIGVNPVLYLAAPVVSLFASLARVRRDPVREPGHHPRHVVPLLPVDLRPERRAAGRLRARLAQLLRLPGRRLVVELQVQPARVDARRQPADLLRGQPGAGGDRRRHDEPHALADRDRGRAAPRRHCPTSCPSSSGSSSTWWPRPPRRAVSRSTCPRPRASSSPATTPSTAACASRCSRTPSTSP